MAIEEKMLHNEADISVFSYSFKDFFINNQKHLKYAWQQNITELVTNLGAMYDTTTSYLMFSALPIKEDRCIDRTLW